MFKETKIQLTIMNFERKSFAPKYRSINQFSPFINNVECFICHKYGHVSAKCRSKLFWSETDRHYTKSSSAPRYSCLFKGYYFSCSNFGHKAVDCNGRKIIQTHYDPNAPFSCHIRCYAFNKYGHVEK